MVRLLALLLTIGTPVSAEPLLLDDFGSARTSTWGPRWIAFTDGVMGGVSAMRAEHHDDDVPHLHMTGDVRLENNGGFVQVALPLDAEGPLDATAFRAIRLRVKGNGAEYYVHLRNDDTRLPWQYYAASFTAPEEWTDVEVAFEDFEPASLRRPLDRGALRRLAVVAAKQRMRADVSIARVELVR